MSGPNVDHPDEDRVYACPACDSASQLYEREDGSVRCYDCGWIGGVADLVERDGRRGSNLTTADCRRGGLNGPDYGAERMRELARKRWDTRMEAVHE